MDMLKVLGRYIADRRREKGFRRQEDLVNELRRRGMIYSRSVIASLETGHGIPSSQLLKDLEDVLEIPRPRLIRFGALMHTKTWYDKMMIPIEEFPTILEGALKSDSTCSDEFAAPPSPPLAQEDDRSVKVRKIRRSPRDTVVGCLAMIGLLGNAGYGVLCEPESA